jgi:hypothetical protein
VWLGVPNMTFWWFAPWSLEEMSRRDVIVLVLDQVMARVNILHPRTMLLLT